MYYLLNQEENTFGILNYLESNAVEVEDFYLGASFSTEIPCVQFELLAKRRAASLKKVHLVDTANGPLIVSKDLKDAIEIACAGEVEFIPVSIKGGTYSTGDFFAINPVHTIDCIDMQASEHELINFDPNDQKFSFLYTKLKDGFSCEWQVGWCLHNRSYIVVSDLVRQACAKKNLTGLKFCTAIDLTYGDRTDCRIL